MQLKSDREMFSSNEVQEQMKDIMATTSILLKNREYQIKE
jgi:hypothetical protein